MFHDRKDAGEQLANAFKKYQAQGVIVLAIPRGGVRVGYFVAKFLCGQFSMVVARKLPFPDEPEAGFEAVAEDGSAYIFKKAARGLSEDTIRTVQKEQAREIGRRVEALRQGMPLPDIRDKTVILVDDGIAMGLTMRA